MSRAHYSEAEVLQRAPSPSARRTSTGQVNAAGAVEFVAASFGAVDEGNRQFQLGSYGGHVGHLEVVVGDGAE